MICQSTPGCTKIKAYTTKPDVLSVFGAPIEVFPMHAIIETGGKQYRVAPGDVIRVPKLTGDIGSEIEFSKVLAIFGDGGEVLAGAEAGDRKISGTITANGRAKKILVFKFKR